MDPDSRRVQVTVSDGRGRSVPDGGLARWLAGLAPARLRGQVAIALVSDQRVRALNRRYRRKDRTTDVLSFPAEDFRLKPEATQSRGATSASARVASPTREVASAFRRKAAESRLLGDIVIATGVARRQARDAGHGYATELRVLALHGLLHLLGYDHHHPDDNGRMARAEARLRRQGGLREGLIARSRTPAPRPPAPANSRTAGRRA